MRRLRWLLSDGRRYWSGWSGLLGLLALLACRPPTTTPSPPPLTIQPIPTLDVTQHNVPLEEIFFDTFRSNPRAVPLPEAEPELVARLLNAIPPIDVPNFGSVDEADWLEEDALVLGYADQAQAWAFPLSILNYHELVNTTLAGRPVLISYCPLCYSGLVYSRQVGDKVLHFGNTSALYQSSLVMVDDATGSYWWQAAGEAIAGPLTGARLELLPGQIIAWETWRVWHPHTQVLLPPTASGRNYADNPFAAYPTYLNEGNFAFPVREALRDPRLPAGAIVLLVTLNDAARVYPTASLAGQWVQDQVGDRPLVVAISPDGRGGVVWDPGVDGQTLTFTAVDAQWRDDQTGSLWNMAGEATAGPLQGQRLNPLPARTLFWFAAATAAPGVAIFQP